MGGGTAEDQSVAWRIESDAGRSCWLGDLIPQGADLDHIRKTGLYPELSLPDNCFFLASTSLWHRGKYRWQRIPCRIFIVLCAAT